MVSLPSSDDSVIPVSEAEEFGLRYNLNQVLIFAFARANGKTYVTTWGSDDASAASAAYGGNRMKSNWGWPECTIVESERVNALHDQIKALQERNDELQSYVRHLEDQWRNNQ